MPRGPRRALPVALLLVAVLVAVLATALAGTALAIGQPGPTGGEAAGADGAFLQQQSPAQQDGNVEDVPYNRTVIRVNLQGDSDARWTITERFNLTTQEEREAFEDLAQQFEDGEAAQLGLPRFRTALSRVEPTVDRPMRIHDVTRTTSAEDGTLRMSFTWTNFAREDNETRYVADAFTTERGTWLGSLGPDQRLIVELPAGSALDTLPRQMTDGTMRWEGPTTFQPGYMQITYTADPPPQIPSIVWGIALALVVFALLALVGGYLLTRDDGRSLPGFPVGGDGDDSGTAATDQPGNDDVATDGTEGAAAAAASDGDATETADDDGPDLSLLSDEERVEYLIEENGGRMKQARIVKETGWSNAKVSQLLSSMEDEDRIAKLRIGRENLISFPDEDIGDFEYR